MQFILELPRVGKVVEAGKNPRFSLCAVLNSGNIRQGGGQGRTNPWRLSVNQAKEKV
jgi:ribosomal protein S5